MNERIRELAEQATSSYQTMDGEWEEDFDKEKLAELIVLDCMRVIKNNQGHSLSVSNFTDEKAQGIQLGLQFAILDIAEHFGVDE